MATQVASGGTGDAIASQRPDSRKRFDRHHLQAAILTFVFEEYQITQYSVPLKDKSSLLSLATWKLGVLWTPQFETKWIDETAHFDFDRQSNAAIRSGPRCFSMKPHESDLSVAEIS